MTPGKDAPLPRPLPQHGSQAPLAGSCPLLSSRRRQSHKQGTEFHCGHSPSRPKVPIRVEEGRAVLLEVAVQGGGKALEAHPKELVKGFEDVHWKSPLQASPFIEPNAKHHLRRKDGSPLGSGQGRPLSGAGPTCQLQILALLRHSPTSQPLGWPKPSQMGHTWYLRRRHQTLGRKRSKPESSMQLYR